MITKELIARINELARKAGSVGLTEEESAERDQLRKQYLQAFRSRMRAQLEMIEFTDSRSGASTRLSDRKKR
jgi:uncharacterized protein YnzC (UPF0291/DUF896 family)